MRNRKGQVWYYVDVNSAHLNWTAAYRVCILGKDLDPRGLLSVIGGGGVERHGVVLTRSSSAKGYGIRTGETLAEARCRCPGPVIVPPGYNPYMNCSSAFVELLKKYLPYVHQCSTDEAFCQMEGTMGLWGARIAFARQLKEEIHRELGFTVNIGVSDSKLLVRMVSRFQRPDQVHTLFTWKIERKMQPLPVNELSWMGPTTVRKLRALGIGAMGALAASGLELLKRHLKRQGEFIQNYANERDVSPFSRELPQNKGYGNSMTTPSDVTGRETTEQVMLSLTKTVCTRLRADGVKATCVSISAIDRKFRHGSGQTTLISVTGTTLGVYEAARSLFDRLWNYSPIRQIGVHTSKVSPRSHYQYQLFDRELRDKYTRLDTVTDEMRKRYGEDYVQRAAFMGDRIPHMSSGIDKVKRIGATKAVQRPGPGSGARDRNHGSGEDRAFR